MRYKTEVELIDLYTKISPGPWTLSKNNQGDWQLFANSRDKIRFVCKGLPRDLTNYDMRAISLVPELIREALELRIASRKEHSLTGDTDAP